MSLLGMMIILSAHGVKASFPVSMIPAPANAESRAGTFSLHSGSRMIADPDLAREAESFSAKPAEVKTVWDWMALHKINRFQWHLTDDHGWRIQIDKDLKLTGVGAWREGIGFDPKSSAAYDPLGRCGGYYTKVDIREIVAYAAERHITVAPEIEMPGHSKS